MAATVNIRRDVRDSFYRYKCVALPSSFLSISQLLTWRFLRLLGCRSS